MSVGSKRIAIFGLGMVLISLVVIRYEAMKTERDSRGLLQDSLKLRVGVSSAQEVLAIIHGPGRVTDGFEECVAGHGDCYGNVAVRNRFLNLLHLAPDVGLGACFGIQNHILIFRHLQMVAIIDGIDRHSFVTEEQAYIEKPPFRVIRSNNHTYLGIFMTPSAGDEFRRRVTDFNLRCLSKIGGCKTFEEMLPILGREDWTWLAYPAMK
jgi:hypothetical protein